MVPEPVSGLPCVSSLWDMTGYLQREVLWWPPVQIPGPRRPTPLRAEEQQLYFHISADDRALRPVSEAETWKPTDVRLLIHEDFNPDVPVDPERCFSNQLYGRLVQSVHYGKLHPNASMILLLHSNILFGQDTSLKFLYLKKRLFPIQR